MPPPPSESPADRVADPAAPGSAPGDEGDGGSDLLGLPPEGDPAAAPAPAGRPSVPEMEALLGRVLPAPPAPGEPFALAPGAAPPRDRGFVRVVDYMGDDAAIVQAARVSYGRGTRRVSQDRGLVRFLMRHRHTTPFEMCEVKLHLKLPIFVARQLVRHRTASINEHSARYSVVPDEFLVPSPGDLAEQSKTNRQGRGGAAPRGAEAMSARMGEHARASHALYRDLLNEPPSEGAAPPRPGEPGLARELARAVLPLSSFTEMYWKCDLHNFLRFVSLRIDPHAQKEIRAYAEVFRAVAERWVPIAAEAHRDYELEGARLSRMERGAVRALLSGAPVSPDALGMTAREWREFCAALDLDPETGRPSGGADGGSR